MLVRMFVRMTVIAGTRLSTGLQTTGAILRHRYINHGCLRDDDQANTRLRQMPGGSTTNGRADHHFAVSHGLGERTAAAFGLTPGADARRIDRSQGEIMAKAGHLPAIR